MSILRGLWPSVSGLWLEEVLNLFSSLETGSSLCYVFCLMHRKYSRVWVFMHVGTYDYEGQPVVSQGLFSTCREKISHRTWSPLI